MTVVADMTMSLDGFVTGPHDGQGRGLGEGGERLHNWVMGGPWTYAGGSPFQAKAFDRKVLDEALGAAGAIIIGRRMYDVVDGWGDSSPFDRPVFVVTSRPHPRPLAGKTSYTFVTGGIHDALAQAEQAAGGQDISVGGGASVIQQFLAAGLVGQLNLHLSPVLLGSGKRLFENLAAGSRPSSRPGYANHRTPRTCSTGCSGWASWDCLPGRTGTGPDGYPPATAPAVRLSAQQSWKGRTDATSCRGDRGEQRDRRGYRDQAGPGRVPRDPGRPAGQPDRGAGRPAPR